MASSATTRPAFSLHTPLPHQSPQKSRTHLPIPSPFLKHHPFSPLHRRPNPQFTEVYKKDQPISEVPTEVKNPHEAPQLGPEHADLPASGDKPARDKLDERRLEEKFAVLNTGIFECRSCGFRYDEAAGDPNYPIPAGMEFGRLPEDWRCPTCGAAKGFFESKSVEIAGFAQNQQFGLGGNALTSGQKSLIIYGSLCFFFLLFLSGYFLQ